MPVSVSRSCRQHLQTAHSSADVSATEGKSHYACVKGEKQEVCSEHNIFSSDVLPSQVSSLTLSTRFTCNQLADTLKGF